MTNLEHSLEQVAEQLKTNGSPTDTKEAEYLWRWCSRSEWISITRAKELYKIGGYIPFSGFPLKRQLYWKEVI